MAKLIYPEGLIAEVSPQNGSDFQLEELREFVGGYIEIVYMPDGQIMVINEEGKLMDLQYNHIATMQSGLYPFDFIAGNALICKPDEIQ